MNRILAIFTLLIAVSYAQQNEEFDKLLNNLEEVGQYYKESARKNPDNKGANILAANLGGTTAALQSYKAGTIKRGEAMKNVEDALEIADNYKTDKAKEAAKHLRSLRRILPTMPMQLELDNIASPEEVKELGIEDDEPNIEIKDTGTEGLEKTMVYLLFGLYLLAVVVFGLILTGLHKRRLRKLKTEIQELKRTIDDLDFGSQDPAAYAEVVQNDLKKRWDKLENNTVDFIGKVESQLQELRDKVSLQDTGNIEALERRLKAVEQLASAAPVAPTTVEAETPKPEIAEKEVEVPPVVGAIVSPEVEEVATPEQQPNEVVDLVERAIARLKDGSAYQPLVEQLASGQPETKVLASLLQELYITELEVGKFELFKKLMDSLNSMGLQAEDSMAGRMSFSDFYADNVSLDILRDEESPQVPGFDNTALLQKAESAEVFEQAVMNTVLLTVRPTIMQIQEGAKTVLKRGLYVIKS